MQFRVLVVLLLLFSAATVNLRAQVLVLDPVIQGAPLGDYMSVWVDESGEADWQAVRRQSNWMPVASSIPNYGLDTSAYWFRMRVQNSYQLDDWLLEIPNPLLNELDVYIVSEKGQLISHQALGLSRPMEGRLIVHRDNLVPITFPYEARFEIYLKAKSFHSIQMPAYLWPMKEFILQKEGINVAVGMLAGALAIMLFYNFFLYTTFRDPIYLMYLGAVASFLLLQLGFKGLGHRYLWPGGGFWPDVSVFFPGYCALYFSSTFAREFLELKKRGFSLLWIVESVRALSAVAIFGLAFIDLHQNLYFTAALSTAVICVGFIAIFTYYRSDDRPFQIFTAGWVVFMLGALLYIMNKLGWISVNWFTEQTFALGMLMEVILFSMALGDRINAERAQALEAKQQQLSAMQAERVEKQKLLEIEALEREANELTLNARVEHNAQLEKSIADRTRELQQATQQYQKLVRLDSLTQVYSRHYFNERMASCFGGAAEQGQMVSLLMIDVDHFKSVNDRYGHAVGDTCLREVAGAILAAVRDSGGEVFRFGGEEFAVLLSGTDVGTATDLASVIHLKVETLQLDKVGSITVSVGVATIVPQFQQRPEDLVELADRALYRAKSGGRNRTELASQVERRRGGAA